MAEATKSAKRANINSNSGTNSAGGDHVDRSDGSDLENQLKALTTRQNILEAQIQQAQMNLRSALAALLKKKKELKKKQQLLLLQQQQQQQQQRQQQQEQQQQQQQQEEEEEQQQQQDEQDQDEQKDRATASSVRSPLVVLQSRVRIAHGKLASLEQMYQHVTNTLVVVHSGLDRIEQIKNTALCTKVIHTAQSHIKRLMPSEETLKTTVRGLDDLDFDRREFQRVFQDMSHALETLGQPEDGDLYADMEDEELMSALEELGPDVEMMDDFGAPAPAIDLTRLPSVPKTQVVISERANNANNNNNRQRPSAQTLAHVL
jgi:DNA repair exonuclease SbcCD ATPase subunit